MLQLLQQHGVTRDDIQLMENMTTALLVLTIASIVATIWLARRKRLSVGFWATMALLFGPLALVAILFAAARPKTNNGVNDE
jgi:hypothetical protein